MGEDSYTQEDSGLTPEEAEVMRHLVLAVNLFNALPGSRTPREEFVRGIHQCQHVLGGRVLARDYPGFWRE